MENLENRLMIAFNGAIVSRGKFKGMLKAKSPLVDSDAGIMWQACVQIANPFKASIYAVILCCDREFYRACVEFAENREDMLRGLDRDRVALSRLGVW